MVEIRDRPSERCWGKLYEFLDEEERDSEELAEALYEANSYKSIYGLRLSYDNWTWFKGPSFQIYRAEA